MTRLLHNIGASPSKERRIASNYNTVEEVAKCGDPLTFDGVYVSAWWSRYLLEGREFTLFPMGAYMGHSNSFDEGMPLEWYCTASQIVDLMDMGGKLGWHTYTHPNLTEVPMDSARLEMTAPEWARERGCEDFAYPYGAFNEDLKKVAEDLGYKRAWSVTQGDGSDFALRRDYL